MMGRGRLLYVINHADWFWSHRLPLALGAQAQGWDVGVAVAGAVGDPRFAAQGFKPLDLPGGGIAGVIMGLARLIRAEKPDLIHAVTLKYAFITGLAVRLSGARDVRIVYTIAGLGYLFSGEGLKPKILRALAGPFLKLALKARGARLIFQNPDDRALLIRRGFADPQNCALIRGSGVDMRDFPATPLPPGDRPLVLMPTRLVRDKGLAVFVEAARIVEQAGIPARFMIAGGVSSGNPRALTQADMEALLAGSPVEWPGKVGDMPALYQSATLICYPSWYGEGVPKVLLEACASGRPIVTTDHPGCREAVRGGENGFLVPVKDAQATAEAIMMLLADRPQMEAMGAASRRIAEEEFATRLVVDKTLAVYGAA